jgi:TldD protein
MLGNAAALVTVWHPVLRVRDGSHEMSRQNPNFLSERLPETDALVQAAVDAAVRAGAQYADARMTRTVVHPMKFTAISQWTEVIGLGVRALVNGYWGFTAVPGGDRAAAEQLARDAVAQAKMYARALPRTVELGTIPTARGHWTMPVKVDPFTISMEEKLAFLRYWLEDASQIGVTINTRFSELHFLRQECTVATSEGASFSQIRYESGGKILAGAGGRREEVALQGLTPAGVGWELVLNAKIPEQLRQVRERVAQAEAGRAHQKPVQVGRYTLVCDGATMAALLDRTLGIATQLDRAYGYEANTSGTSFLSDPLNMLGTFQLASSHVSITANRSAPTQLATVRWDDEGVEPADFTLVQDGVLMDYQTTREQAAWLAPYYQRHNHPVQSHGCAMADSALCIPVQQTPNLALRPAPSHTNIEDLVATVRNGILITDGAATADFQARTGMLHGTMHEIKNGRVARALVGAAVRFDTLDLWKNIIVLGGPSTQVTSASSWYPYPADFERMAGMYPVKGEPPQRASNSVQAVAAVITNQTVIDPRRKA